jgi:hypothetical protein
MNWHRWQHVKARVRRGFFYPLLVSDVIAEAKRLEICDRRQKLIPIRFENPKNIPSLGCRLFSLRPQDNLALYSLPKTVDSASARTAALRSLEVLADLNRKPKECNTFNKAQFVYYTMYLTNDGDLKATRGEIVEHFETRVRDDFSDVFQPQHPEQVEYEIQFNIKAQPYAPANGAAPRR